MLNDQYHLFTRLRSTGIIPVHDELRQGQAAAMQASSESEEGKMIAAESTSEGLGTNVGTLIVIGCGGN